MQAPQDLAETVVNPRSYADWPTIDAAYQWLRREAPVALLSPHGYDPFWAVTKRADIMEVERQNELFHNGDKSAVLSSREQAARTRELTGGSPVLIKTLISMDNPEHVAFRRMTQGAFLAQKLKALEPRIRELARDSIDRMAELGGRCDFARDIAMNYPLRVIMELLGVPREDEPLMLKLTQENFGANDPDMNRSGERVDPAKMAEDQHKTFADMIRYFDVITEDRRRCPRSDIASIIANGQIEGQPIGYQEAMGYYIIVATAGHDTTSNTLSGGLWALAERPEQFAKLKANPSLIASHVEESIRWETPVKHFMRTATADAEVGGQKITKGEQLMLCYASANRDEEAFENAYEYDIEREPNKQLAFGYGAHVCLGQHLARMELRIFWEELLPRLESVELAAVPARSFANFVSGPKRVPISYRIQ
jgi:cytochrome P450